MGGVRGASCKGQRDEMRGVRLQALRELMNFMGIFVIPSSANGNRSNVQGAF